MDVKSLILEDERLADTGEDAPVKSKRAKPKVALEVVVNDGCDVAIRRKTAKTSRLLVLLVSQKQYYIKDEASGDIERINLENPACHETIAAFFRQTTGVEAGSIRGSWLFKMDPGQEAARGLKRLLQDLGRDVALLEMFRHGYGFFDSYRPHFTLNSDRYGSHRALCRHVLDVAAERSGSPIQEVIASIGRADSKWTNLVDSLAGLSAWEERYSLDSACRLVDRWAKTPFPSLFENGPYICKRLFEEIPDPRRLAEYILHLQEHEGYGDCLQTAMNLHVDALECQKQAYGEVRDRYPENLATYHDRVAYLARQRRAEEQTAAFEKVAPKLAKREWSGGGWSVIAPRSADDMFDEAAQQHSCVAGYIDRVCKGKTEILFLRKSDSPAKSVATLQVTGGRVVQAKMACNRSILPAHRSVLEQWAEEQGLEVGLCL